MEIMDDEIALIGTQTSIYERKRSQTGVHLDLESISKAQSYALACMVTYVQHQGGRVISASIRNSEEVSIKIEPRQPFLALDIWKNGRSPDGSYNVDFTLKDLLENGEMLICAAHIGLNAAYLAAGKLAFDSRDGWRYLGSTSQFYAAHVHESNLMETGLGRMSFSALWKFFKYGLRKNADEIVQNHWRYVERFQKRIERNGGITGAECEESSMKVPLSKVPLEDDVIVNEWKWFRDQLTNR